MIAAVVKNAVALRLVAVNVSHVVVISAVINAVMVMAVDMVDTVDTVDVAMDLADSEDALGFG